MLAIISVPLYLRPVIVKKVDFGVRVPGYGSYDLPNL